MHAAARAPPQVRCDNSGLPNPTAVDERAEEPAIAPEGIVPDSADDGNDADSGVAVVPEAVHIEAGSVSKSRFSDEQPQGITADFSNLARTQAPGPTPFPNKYTHTSPAQSL
jgi:hypothetical protein